MKVQRFERRKGELGAYLGVRNLMTWTKLNGSQWYEDTMEQMIGYDIMDEKFGVCNLRNCVIMNGYVLRRG